MTKFRTYDYALGRFWQIDPLADQAGQEIWTTYHYSFNNPIRWNDPFGDCVGGLPCQSIEPNGVVAGGIGGDAFIPQEALELSGLTGGSLANVGVDAISGIGGIQEPTKIGLQELNQASLSAFEPNAFGKTKEVIDDLPLGLDFAGNLAFDFVDKAFITFQVGANRRNLEDFGVSNNEITDAGVNTLTSAIHVSKLTSPVLKGVTAPRFSQFFKGTFVSSLQPQMRGILNRQLNTQFVKKQVQLFFTGTAAGAKVLGSSTPDTN